MIANRRRESSPFWTCLAALAAAAAFLGAWSAGTAVAEAIAEPESLPAIEWQRDLGVISEPSTDDGHERPDVARNAEGHFVIVWIKQTGSLDSLIAQRYDPDGDKLGGPIVVDTEVPPSALTNANVSIDGDGDFVVAWNRKPSGGSRAGHARVYYASGTPKTNEFQVTANSGDQTLSGVASDQFGFFVVVWSGENGHDGDGAGIYSRRYSEFGFQSGTPGSISQVNSTTNGDQKLPEVAMTEDGQAVVSYASDANPEVNPEGKIMARRLAQNSPSPTGSEITVDTEVDDVLGDETSVDIADDGSFVVGWSDILNSFVRAYHSTGSPATDVVRANKSTSGEQNDVDVAIKDDGSRWVATWEDEDDTLAMMRSFTTAGAVESSDLYVLNFSEWEPAIAMKPDGDFVVAFHSHYPGRFADPSDAWGDPHIGGSLYTFVSALRAELPVEDFPVAGSGSAARIDRGGNVPFDLQCPLQQQQFCSYEFGGSYQFDRGYLPPGVFKRRGDVASGPSAQVAASLGSGIRAQLSAVNSNQTNM